MWIDEFVKNAITGHSSTPIPNATPGQRYFRHGRARQTCCPTTASHRRQRPTNRIPLANSQWTISACGSMVVLQVREQRLRDHEREEDPDHGDEQRRLGDEPPDSLATRMQDRQAVRLQDPPDAPARDRGGADQRNGARTERRPSGGGGRGVLEEGRFPWASFSWVRTRPPPSPA